MKLDEQILEVLNDWDPINIRAREGVDPGDEYAHYVTQLKKLLQSDADLHKIRSRLEQLERVTIGVPSPTARLDEAARRLAELS